MPDTYRDISSRLNKILWWEIYYPSLEQKGQYDIPAANKPSSQSLGPLTTQKHVHLHARQIR